MWAISIRNKPQRLIVRELIKKVSWGFLSTIKRKYYLKHSERSPMELREYLALK